MDNKNLFFYLGEWWQHRKDNHQTSTSVNRPRRWLPSPGSILFTLLVVGMLADRFGSYGPAFTVVAIGPVLAAVLVLRCFPETARVELEVLNPGDADLGGAPSDGAAPDGT